MKRDTLGQALAAAVSEMKAEDDRTFSIILKKPFPLLLEAIGKLSSNVPFVMPERIAKTDANTQITDKLRFWACLTSPSSFGGAKPRAAGDRDAGSRHPAGYAA
jgi:hypothetical protein